MLQNCSVFDGLRFISIVDHNQSATRVGLVFKLQKKIWLHLQKNIVAKELGSFDGIKMMEIISEMLGDIMTKMCHFRLSVLYYCP